CQGFALAKSSEPAGRIYAPEVLAFTGNPAEVSSGYGGGQGGPPEMFTVAVLDEDGGSLLAESTELRMGGAFQCALPRAAAASATGSLFVSCLGSDLVVELDGASISPATVQLNWWSVPAGPTGLAVDDEHRRAIVWSQHAQSLSALAGPEVKSLV